MKKKVIFLDFDGVMETVFLLPLEDEDYLESVYYSPHVKKLLKEKEFKDLLEYLNIDDVHATIDGCQDWPEIH